MLSNNKSEPPTARMATVTSVSLCVFWISASVLCSASSETTQGAYLRCRIPPVHSVTKRVLLQNLTCDPSECWALFFREKQNSMLCLISYFKADNHHSYIWTGRHSATSKSNQQHSTRGKVEQTWLGARICAIVQRRALCSARSATVLWRPCGSARQADGGWRFIFDSREGDKRGYWNVRVPYPHTKATTGKQRCDNHQIPKLEGSSSRWVSRVERVFNFH